MGLETSLNYAEKFSLARPDSVHDAINALLSGEDALVMAGGQSLTVLLTQGLATPDVVVSLRRCRELSTFEWDDDEALVAGAMVTTRTVETDARIGASVPLLAEAARTVGSPHVRNFGTVVGSVCHADPGGDLAPVLLCLGAEMIVRGSGGERRVPIEEFVAGPYTNTLAKGEIATGVSVPAQRNQVGAYRKVVRRGGDLALASAAVLLSFEEGRVTDAKVSLGGLVTRPFRLRPIENEVIGMSVGGLRDLTVPRSLFADEVPLLADHDDADDIRYREILGSRLVARVVRDAIGAM